MTTPRDPSEGLEPYRPSEYPTEPLPSGTGYGPQPTIPLPNRDGAPQPTPPQPEPPRQSQLLPYAEPAQLQWAAIGQPAAAAGWYPDQKSGLMRWWDGTGWTEHFGPQVAPGLAVVAPKDMTVAYLFAIFLGGLGIHRFYLGRTGSAVGLLLLSVFGWATSWAFVGFALLAAAWIWQIVDLFLIPGMVRERNGVRRY